MIEGLIRNLYFFPWPKTFHLLHKPLYPYSFARGFSLCHSEAASRYRRLYPQPGGSEQENGFSMRGLKQG